MNRWDLIVAFGVILLAVGAGLIYFPAGVIVAGLGCVGFGAAGAYVEGRVTGGSTSESGRRPNGGEQS